MAIDVEVDYEAADKHLKRTIGLFSLIGLAVSIQVGSGWLLATLAAVSRAGPAAIVAWVLGAVFFAVIGISWMELGTMLPRSGGGVRYPRMTHGGFLSWINGWGYLIAVIALPVIETQAVLTYIGGHWKHLGLIKQSGDGPVMLAWPTGIITGWIVLLIFLALNIFGATLLTESNKVVTIWKLVIPALTVILMFTAFDSSNFSEHGGFAPMGWGAVFGAVSGGGIVFAYVGIRQIVDFGGEVINPKKNIPLAMLIGGLLIPLVLYTLLQTAFIGAIDWSKAEVARGDWAGLFTSPWASEPLLAAVTAAGFSWFALVLLSDAVLSPAACGWVWVGLGGRTLYSMSVNNEMPQNVQKMNRFGVPWLALTITTAVGFLMFLPVPSWYTFVGMVSTALVLNYLIAGPCMAVFARCAPELPRPIKVPASTFWGCAGYVCSLLLCFWAGWMTMVNVMTVVIIGLPIYASYSSVKSGFTPARGVRRPVADLHGRLGGRGRPVGLAVRRELRRQALERRGVSAGVPAPRGGVPRRTVGHQQRRGPQAHRRRPLGARRPDRRAVPVVLRRHRAAADLPLRHRHRGGGDPRRPDLSLGGPCRTPHVGDGSGGPADPARRRAGGGRGPGARRVVSASPPPCAVSARDGGEVSPCAHGARPPCGTSGPAGWRPSRPSR
ncbi:APC family permease [Gordonia sp. PP30]|uniref:APC family permease n=1 Tax=Gordonia sp. PP30 TaxID=2935861 RepID=UPI001FFFBF0D|nr:APC family permease [Gordonia sp. PP30]UQE75475.1 APC family permease [Gordonia sp. PP30]